MDNFKIFQPRPEQEKEEEPFLEMVKESKKMYECAQYECISRHLGRAVAFKNYWVYLYDIIQK